MKAYKRALEDAGYDKAEEVEDTKAKAADESQVEKEKAQL